MGFLQKVGPSNLGKLIPEEHYQIKTATPIKVATIAAPIIAGVASFMLLPQEIAIGVTVTTILLAAGVIYKANEWFKGNLYAIKWAYSSCRWTKGMYDRITIIETVRGKLPSMPAVPNPINWWKKGSNVVVEVQDHGSEPGIEMMSPAELGVPSVAAVVQQNIDDLKRDDEKKENDEDPLSNESPPAVDVPKNEEPRPENEANINEANIEDASKPKQSSFFKKIRSSLTRKKPKIDGDN